MIVLDTTRADHCGFVGYERDTTPTLDRLAAEGAAFTNAWSPAGWTAPAHASIFTGLRPENHHLWTGERPDLGREQITLAELLRDAGYATAAFSCNWFVSDQFGLLQGFDEKAMVLGADRSVEGLGLRAQEHAVRWIDAQQKPWFAFLNLMEPHIPYAPPWAYERRFVRAGVEPERLQRLRAFDYPATVGHMLGVTQVSDDDLLVLSDLYDAEIAAVDTVVGKLVAHLQEKGVLDDTIVVIAGDHGENLGEHGLVSHRFSIHRAIRHVPLLLRYPPRIDAGRVETRTVRLEDVSPSVLELCDVPSPVEPDGASLLGDVGNRTARAIQGPIPIEFQQRVAAVYPGKPFGPLAGGIRAVFDGKFHLILHDDGREELYEIARDPKEADNLAGKRPGISARLRELLPSPTGR